MKILGIETSCDETAAAIVENGTKIISNVVASSSDLHQKTGGVIPEVAAREQMKYIIPVIEEVLNLYSSNEVRSSSANSSRLHSNNKNIDAIAVTVGPGLIGSLLVGVEIAKTLAYSWNKPIIPVNHLVGHIYANWLDNNNKPEFPTLCLVVSGGHTELVLMENHGQLKYLGGTRDDAAGECFDKSARLLGLSAYNGGPAIAAAAAKFKVRFAKQNLRKQTSSKFKVSLPRPMVNSNDLDFSFSGLKTAILREVNKLQTMKQFSNQTIEYLAYELQEAITDVLVAKVLKAIELYQPKSFLLAGGVAANQKLREKLTLEIGKEKSEIKLFVPTPKLCTDNAAYIASCAFFNNHPLPWKKITADPGLTIV